MLQLVLHKFDLSQCLINNIGELTEVTKVCVQRCMFTLMSIRAGVDKPVINL